jgi:hypothetical protein
MSNKSNNSSLKARLSQPNKTPDRYNLEWIKKTERMKQDI